MLAQGKFVTVGTGVSGEKTHWRVAMSKIKTAPGVAVVQGVCRASGVSK
jgi:hypothetical protein